MAASRPPARARLLHAADAVLFADGIRATPVDALLRHAEVSPATMYAHFPSKDALVAEALRLRLAEWRTVWDRCIAAASDDAGRLLAVFDALDSYRRDRQPAARWCAFLATASEMPDAVGEIRELLEQDTALLEERFHALARPLADERAGDLAAEVLLAYSGTLAGLLRGRPAEPITVGRRVAAAAVRAHLAD